MSIVKIPSEDAVQELLKKYSLEMYEKAINGWKECEKQNTILQKQLAVAVEALKFVSMPITGKNLTVENLLHTIENDSIRAQQALDKISELTKEK